MDTRCRKMEQFITFRRVCEDFNVEKHLGEGGFGTVFKCASKMDGTAYAIKFFKVDPLYMKFYMREAKSLAILKHPNIVGYHTAWKEKGGEKEYIFIQMEFCEGGSLLGLLQRGELRYDAIKAWRLLSEVLTALDFLNERGFIHRDIKPVSFNFFYSSAFKGNILITADRRAKLGDLGLARPESKDRMTAGQGTRYYIAPEAMNEHYTSKIDIYSLGIVIFEILCYAADLDRDPYHHMQEFQRHDKFPSGFGALYEIQDVIIAKNLIREMTRVDPLERPTARELLARSPFQNFVEKPSTPIKKATSKYRQASLRGPPPPLPVKPKCLNFNTGRTTLSLDISPMSTESGFVSTESSPSSNEYASVPEEETLVPPIIKARQAAERGNHKECFALWKAILADNSDISEADQLECLQQAQIYMDEMLKMYGDSKLQGEKKSIVMEIQGISAYSIRRCEEWQAQSRRGSHQLVLLTNAANFIHKQSKVEDAKDKVVLRTMAMPLYEKGKVICERLSPVQPDRLKFCLDFATFFEDSGDRAKMKVILEREFRKAKEASFEMTRLTPEERERSVELVIKIGEKVGK